VVTNQLLQGNNYTSLKGARGAKTILY